MSSYRKFLNNKKIKALQAYRYKRMYKASLSVEAAMCFTLFIIAMAILIMPFDMMNTDRKIRGIAEAVCRDASQYAYTYVRLQKDGAKSRDNISESAYDIESMEKIKPIFTGYALGAFVVAKINSEINDKNIKNIKILSSDCMEDGETICIKINYEYGLPIGIPGYNSIAQTVTVSRRAWVGVDGGKGSSVSSDENEEYVYIGRTSTRYHRNPTCHYLHNDLQAVSISDISNIRNSNGGMYHACERCGNGAAGTVYIMPSGTRYHSSASCSAIVAYVQRVKLSEVEHLGACSYCGGGH